jgi:hypothetical protein
MYKSKSQQNLGSLMHELIKEAGSVLERSTRRMVRIENIIVRDGGLPTLFVVSYPNSYSSDQYFFYLEDLVFPKRVKLEALAV